ncbi:putative NAD(P)H quinone oxidoreductase, PIG3 family [Shimia gijangensis]|uniref:Putative NAD(P)H quinone oxidoreductase, PIG3 family n=1 Tax=Shimia gijangensis TaxID=1470563 RepID=A0A1M6STL7_9RHOB|nr:NAD(P)H-quinone oxidoreductase [Shimia gijangensis]SHK48082.1 putative NAD(P)H quinone oxidoreductase, PIG3 family [Shimia gijangensis]
MKAVCISEPGGPEVLVPIEAENPTAGAGEILVAVRAAGVNRPDVAQRLGRYPVPADANPLPGLEIAGTVAEIGEGVSGFKIGDPVMSLTHGGGYASLCAVDARHALKIPAGLDFAEAAALPEVAYTVEFNMVMRVGLNKSEIVLIHGGSSGIGSHAIARARSLGAIPIVTAGSDEKCAYCVSHGAEHAINYRSSDWEEQVMALTDGKGVDVVLDMVAGEYTNKNFNCLANDGRYALISLQGGRDVNVNLNSVLRRRLTLTGSTLRPLPSDKKALIADKLGKDVVPLLAEGKMRPHIHATFPLAKASEAHRMMEDGAHLGKIVLLVE